MKKHVDTVIILGAFATSILWMNGRFNSLEKDMAIILKTAVEEVKLTQSFEP